MLLFLFLFGLPLGEAAPSVGHNVTLQRGSCPMFWYGFNGRCYKYIATRATWVDAELHCVSEGANLVSIHNVEEHNFVKDLIKNFDHAAGTTWIGLADAHKEGTWMWSDGEAVDFAYWRQSEPNNLGGTENCVHTNHGAELRWNDEDCDYTLPSVCVSRIACPQ